MATSISPAKIVRIVDVRDTRQYEEIDDKWVPIPGSGVERPCDRCGRTHEIHVDVELSDGTTANIGQGCARGESMDVQSKIKGAISAATTLARLKRELAGTKAKLDAAETAWRKVSAMPLPEPVRGNEHDPDKHGHAIEEWAMGDATVWVRFGGTFDTERKQALANSWRNHRYKELGYAFSGLPYSLKEKIKDLTTRVRRAEAKVLAFTHGAPRTTK